jgi:hypothetical protein
MSMSEEGPLRKFLHGEGPILSTLRGKEKMQRFSSRAQARRALGVGGLALWRTALASLPVDKQQLGHIDDLVTEARAEMKRIYDKFPAVEPFDWMSMPTESPSYVKWKWEEALDGLEEAKVRIYQIGFILYGDEWARERHP